ncbi:MAG: S24 family peptidase [Candidatus Thioglobus sp.]|jgi:SOS-response transcriptional repressor LexA|uniref:S24 family peptidase n=2 Tax=Candidatus Thioglobus TaxID=655184 RepID=UPI001D8E17BC|nr:S24 family peptidase [Candidatus Thioglobus sp.]MBT3277730.1 S24 family peptidase [Candidatus Thioglobus sp.]MBT3744440.1 S24 family peptidase [Candidatus Thioglobus sp.]MBT6279165.1 S24 family peptidase [Candidatus Thioglobus sp.]
MSDFDTPQELFESNCSINSEPFALQNLGSYMEPEFSENCIVIIDPGMAVHNRAYAVIRYEDDLYFRQYIERGGDKFLVPLNTQHDEIELKGKFEVVGCVIQQKQRKQKPLHYYHLNTDTKQMDFSISGKVKAKEE